MPLPPPVTLPLLLLLLMTLLLLLLRSMFLLGLRLTGLSNSVLPEEAREALLPDRFLRPSAEQEYGDTYPPLTWGSKIVEYQVI